MSAIITIAFEGKFPSRVDGRLNTERGEPEVEAISSRAGEVAESGLWEEEEAGLEML